MIKNLKKHKIESTYLLLSGAKESNKKRLWKIKLVLIDSSEIIPPNNLHFSPIIHNKIEIQFIKRSIKCPKTKLNTPWDCKVDFWETSKKKEIRTVAFTTKIPEIHKVKQKSQNLLPPVSQVTNFVFENDTQTEPTLPYFDKEIWKICYVMIYTILSLFSLRERVKEFTCHAQKRKICRKLNFRTNFTQSVLDDFVFPNLVSQSNKLNKKVRKFRFFCENEKVTQK